MSDDVTITREMAKRYAGMLRDAFHGMGGAAPLFMVGLADLLDPSGHTTSCRPGCTGLRGAGDIPPLVDVWLPCECACHERGDDE